MLEARTAAHCRLVADAAAAVTAGNGSQAALRDRAEQCGAVLLHALVLRCGGAADPARGEGAFGGGRAGWGESTTILQCRLQFFFRRKALFLADS